ncbi:Rieske (2Fe-2S) protein [Geomonas sp. RF6]|uniref:QcrA and Rieske domain-containing protein n=1 Tax=Geomonas sp. RF6 TaxID=2897342 RepID=UPI001E4C38AF|nr:Rieske (2Fe-2S) protein [Geomonas sp. RF6]UFS69514.1 Rieske (2Fe-2S) protein [Geomonas sp. RF6]
MEKESRRKFLGACLGGAVVVAGAAAIYPIYSYLAPRGATGGAEKVKIPEGEVPEGGARFFEYAGSSAVVVRTKESGVVALSAVCTHLGCIVQWDKQTQNLVCPCHAGHYDAQGNVLSGPPPKPLPKLPFTVSNGQIVVG